MGTFDELYKRVIKNALNGEKTVAEGYEEPKMIHCLENPDEYPLVIRVKPCMNCSEHDRGKCVESCEWGALSFDNEKGLVIDNEKCVGCQTCIDACKLDALTTKKDIIPVINDLKDYDGPVYALVAPAFSGQFGENVTAGKLRSALKKLGFTGMIEVAAFADILTLKEALEFDERINDENDFQLTSCCCPMWIAMIKKQFNQLLPNVPGSVSPMIAGGRTVKTLHPDAKTVFIGPCLAKKAEIKEPDLVGAIDHVLTYQELKDLFSATNIVLEELEEDNQVHSSKSGIKYARSGGVSEAIKMTLEKINPDRKIELKSKVADGVPACRAMITAILNGERDANFYEGMGCVGGCVGGPKAIINREDGKKNVERYADKAPFDTPADNPYVIELIKRLGFETTEDFLKNSTLFDRKL